MSTVDPNPKGPRNGNVWIFLGGVPCLSAAGKRTTLVMSRMARPRSAAATALTPSWPPKIHRLTVSPSAPAVIFSLRDSGPSFLSSSLRPGTGPRHGGSNIKQIKRWVERMEGERRGHDLQCMFHSKDRLWICYIFILTN
jgi:hypothetical protein